MNITTTYTSNATGRSQIIAKGNGKQRTVSYDQSKSADWNHGNAAGTLLDAMFEGFLAREVAASTARIVKHRHNGKMVFAVGV